MAAVAGEGESGFIRHWEPGLNGGLGYPDPEVLGLRWFGEDGIVSLTSASNLGASAEGVKPSV